jgi:plastocyanin
VALLAASPTPAAQPARAREFTIVARGETFDPGTVEVSAGDTVKITLIAEDRPHSFTLDGFRISKRASPGRSATVEFHAEARGRYTFYCSLRDETCCRDMKGELVVH